MPMVSFRERYGRKEMLQNDLINSERETQNPPLKTLQSFLRFDVDHGGNTKVMPFSETAGPRKAQSPQVESLPVSEQKKIGRVD